jgi:hypothetical protein
MYLAKVYVNFQLQLYIYIYLVSSLVKTIILISLHFSRPIPQLFTETMVALSALLLFFNCRF